MIVHDLQGRQVSLGESVGQGGEATVYRVNDASNRLAKIYEPQPRPNYLLKLAWMVEHPPVNPTETLKHPSLAWPNGLLYDSRHRLKGYSMPHIQYAVSLLEVFNPRRRAEVLPQFDRRYLHRTARNLAAAFSALHRSGYVAGDVNESNVLVTPTALVTIIDTDSFQVTEERNGNQIIYPCPVGKPEYTPPELQGKSLVEVTRVPEHDNFGLAVLIFQLLMEGSHPYRAQWLGAGDPPPIETRIAKGYFPYAALSAPIAPPPNGLDLNTLHPALADLFRRCFVDGQRNPRWRPSPELWVRAISDAEQALVCCAQGHYYSSHLDECPYCAVARKRPLVSARPVGQAEDRARGGWPAAPWQTHGAQHAQQNPRPGWGTASPFAGRRGGAAGSGWAGRATSRAGAGAQTVQANRPAPARFPGNFGGWPGSVAAAGAPSVFGGGRMGAPAVGGVLRNRPLVQPGAANKWIRLQIKKSVTIGGAQGALAGAIPGAVVGLINWSSGDLLAYTLLITLGGALGGLLRGWKPGHQLAYLVGRSIGWKRFWEAIGLMAGAAGGLMLGLLFVWAIIPVFLGLILGAQGGLYLGRKVFQAGNLLGWERIGGVLSASATAALGWGLAILLGKVGLNSFGAQLADALLPFSANGSIGWALVWVLVGGLGGALAGGISGALADLGGRFFRLVN